MRVGRMKTTARLVIQLYLLVWPAVLAWQLNPFRAIKIPSRLQRRKKRFLKQMPNCTEDDFFMGLALEQAHLAKEKFNEVPIGAVLVNERKILAAAGNRVETMHDASAHAEMLCFRQASARIHNWRLSKVGPTTLYTTVEPCIMCWAAAHAFRVDRVVYGAPDLRLGSTTIYNLKEHPFHTLNITGGVQESNCRNILVDFFRERRKQDEEKQKGGVFEWFQRHR